MARMNSSVDDDVLVMRVMTRCTFLYSAWHSSNSRCETMTTTIAQLYDVASIRSSWLGEAQTGLSPERDDPRPGSFRPLARTRCRSSRLVQAAREGNVEQSHRTPRLGLSALLFLIPSFFSKMLSKTVSRWRKWTGRSTVKPNRWLVVVGRGGVLKV